MRFYTSRFSNKDLAKANAHVVGITLSPPKFPTVVKVERNIPQFAPSRSIFNMTDKVAFRRRYMEQLDRIGVEGVKQLIGRYDDDKDIIFLCYEDVTCDNPQKNWCHRQYFAEWIEAHLGIKVEEYPDSGNWAAKHPPEERFDQMMLF